VLPDSLTRLQRLLARLPGVGEKTAQRYALFLALDRSALSTELGLELSTLHAHLRACSRCGNIAEATETEDALCAVCRDPKRDPRLLCVVAKIQDLLAIERSGAMRGKYFVLGRLLSPLDGVGPRDLPLELLRQRISEDGVTEAILATPPSVDGEATALFLARELQSMGLATSRIASGVPHGGDLEFADQITLGRAIDGRRRLDSSR